MRRRCRRSTAGSTHPGGGWPGTRRPPDRGRGDAERGALRVHCVDGVRVVDASVFPFVTNGNIYAPTMMTAEKAADLILGNTPLPPERVDFYRHGDSPSPSSSRSSPSSA